jgi:hypothetical protein
MTGIGVLADAPPVPEQEKLHDGVHLRWSSPRDASFPWYGYFLYRRPSGGWKPDGCLADILSGLSLEGADDVVTTGEGWLSSPTELVFTDDFPLAGVPEVDLRHRTFVRFDRPGERPARRYVVRIGFREDHRDVRCVAFDNLIRADRLPLRVGDITISPWQGRRVRSMLVRPPFEPNTREAVALALDGDTEISVPVGVEWVEIELTGTGHPFVLWALSADGSTAHPQRFAGAPGRREIVRLTTAKLTGLRLRLGSGTVFVHSVCYPTAPARERRIRVEGLVNLPGGDGNAVAVVATAIATGKPGGIVEVTLGADRMSGVRIAGGNAAVLNVCWIDVAQDATRGWEPVPKCPQPLSLPVRDPDYPAWTGSTNVMAAEAEGTGRVRYGSGAAWQGTAFADLHEQCAALVKGGPTAGAMNDPSRATQNINSAPQPGPGLQSLHPLDIVMLGSVHRPIAEILGLSWTDETADPNQAYDYLVVTDRDGVSGGDTKKLLNEIEITGFTQGIDGWICFAQRVQQRPPLDPPEDVKVYALPGGSVRPGPPGTTIELIAGSTGLTWASQALEFGWLQPGAFIMHHLWRGDAGQAPQPTLPAAANVWLTQTQPVLSVHSNAVPLAETTEPADWPSFRFNFVDFRLSEGWHVYQLAGVDIFGRFSSKGPFAPWWQWEPEPTPRPWYYNGTSVAQEVHHDAVRILDKRRPPVPVGLESFVLDPDDPLVVQDAAYTAWRTMPGHASTIGLRVRWRWIPEQQLSAPAVTEFRLYWATGTTPPVGWGDPEAWPDRFFVCPYNNNVTVAANGERRYEVILPHGMGGVFAGGVPLSPSAANPIAYANVSVTSADAAAHTPDRRPGGGLVGNESGCATPQKVFRVYRQKPSPPLPIVESDRVYATAANWHGVSYHTFRWAPQADLFTHVCRAIDEAVFETDWAGQPHAAISTNDPAFPDAAAEPIWTQAKKAQIAGVIDQIRDLLGAAPTTAHKASLKPQAFTLYRAFSDDALRVLASRASSDKAFVQVTIRALDASTAPDRRGPDDPHGYTPVLGRCAYLDAVDGRASNRLLYRAAFVDGAQNRSLLGPCATPVRLPDVVPPRAPSVGKVTGGDRTITLSWASNREVDLLEYRIFRAANEADAAVLGTMTQLAVVAADADPGARPARVEWIDVGVPGRKDFFYRIVAVDRPDPVDPRGRGNNLSDPTPAIRARAFDDSVPLPPAITTLEWVRVDDGGSVFPFGDLVPLGAVRLPAVRLAWAPAAGDEKLLLQVKSELEGNFHNASEWLEPGTTTFIHRTDQIFEAFTYRLKVVNGAGTTNSQFAPAQLTAP